MNTAGFDRGWKVISTELTEEGIELFRQHFDYPHHCPICKFTSPDKLWIRKDNYLHCANCDHVLAITFPLK